MSMRDRDQILKELAPLLRKVYKRQSGGCCLHGIVDDGNWDSTYPDDWLKHKECREAYALIQEMDEDDRSKLEHDGGDNLRFAEEPEDDGYEDYDETCEDCGMNPVGGHPPLCDNCHEAMQEDPDYD
jgi:hypothetical protein